MSNECIKCKIFVKKSQEIIFVLNFSKAAY